ncbi:MAG: carbon monoxide dehydrogenase subunit G [Pusillimonas sp.]
MKFTGDQVLNLAREKVWESLMSPETLQAAIPGCESVLTDEQGQMHVVVVAAIGPVKARFKGRMQFTDQKKPERYSLVFEGDGGVAGFAKGDVEVVLESIEPEKTKLVYSAEAQIGGRLAQIGSRLIDATAARMTKQFFTRLNEVVSAPAASVKDGMPQAEGATDVGSPAVSTRGGNGVAETATVTSPEGKGAMVTVQMPAWTWAFTVAVVALLAAYLGAS